MARLTETEDNFIFDFQDMEAIEFMRRRVDDGVHIFTTESFALVGQIVFSKKRFDFNGVRRWVAERFGIEISEDQPAKLELEGYKLYVPIIESTPFSIKEVKLEEKTLLLMRAIPLTEGEHKGFKFSAQVILDAAQKYIDVNLVEHHSWEGPGDTKGTILSVGVVNNTIVVTALITNPETAEKIRSGHFHSTSSNVYLRADDDMEVLEITDVEELTLTDHPADPNAVVLDFKDINIPLTLTSSMKFGSTALAAIESHAGFTTPSLSLTTPTQFSTTKKNGGNQLTEEKKPVAPEPSQVNLESRLAKLENENKKLISTIEQQSKLLVDQAKLQRVLKAESDVKQLVAESKILPSQVDLTTALLIRLGKEERIAFEQFLKLQEFGVAGSEEDLGLVDDKALALSDLTDNQVKLLAMADSQDIWKDHDGGAPGASDAIGQALLAWGEENND